MSGAVYPPVQALPVNVLLLFLDGVGLAPDHPTNNPMGRVGPGFRAFTGGRPWTAETGPWFGPFRMFAGIDACLGLPGLPQSGTGQSTLFTGVNCAALAGRHYGPLPHSSARPVLRESSILRKVADRFGPDAAVFANGFPPQFVEAVSQRDRWPTIARCCRDAGIRIRDLADIGSLRAVAADVTGLGLSRFTDGAVEPRSPDEAASVLLDLAERARFTVFEVFHTDKAGHDQSPAKAMRILDDVDALLWSLVVRMPGNLTLVVTSDHGNVEDLSVRTHTRNQVPLAVRGPGAPLFEPVTDLSGITPVVLALLDP